MAGFIFKFTGAVYPPALVKRGTNIIKQNKKGWVRRGLILSIESTVL